MVAKSNLTIVKVGKELAFLADWLLAKPIWERMLIEKQPHILKNCIQTTSGVDSFLEILEVATIKNLENLVKYLMQTDGIEVKFFFEAIALTDLQKKIDAVLRYYQSSKNLGVSNLQTIEYDTIIDATCERLIAYFKDPDILYSCRIILKIHANDSKTMYEIRHEILEYARYNNSVVDEHEFNQKQIYENFYLKMKLKPNHKLFILSREALIASIPLGKQGLLEDLGIQLGNSKSGQAVILDIWRKSPERANSNFLIIGQSGQGKSTLLKKIMETYKEQQLFLIDPEGEYNLENMGETFKKSIKIGDLILPHMQKEDELEEVCSFYTHHFSLKTESIYAVQQEFKIHLEKYIAMNKYGIEGFINHIKKEGIKLPPACDYYLKDLEKRLKIRLPEQQNNRWQHHHFVIKDIMDCHPKQIRLVLFELLHAMWMQAKSDKSRRKLFLIDESYLFFGRENYECVELLRSIMKRARKYQIAVGFITQNIKDFDDKKMQHLLKPIFDGACYKFIFYQSEEDLQLLKGITWIGEEGIKRISQLEVGSCMVNIGRKYGYVKVMQNTDACSTSSDTKQF
ncbi:hypothetical protein AwErysi_08630 [Erysipelotrichaceae bacterium]|nr:hypothetical protein AwErysi_08630 [Erysipelotrichaceae bacterium]